MDIEQAKFEGFAVVEMMGHRKEVGYVTTEYFGGTALFRVDSPEVPEHEETTKRSGYADTDRGYLHVPAGSTVKRGAIEARSVYVAPASLYALNPCTEAVVVEYAKQKAYGSQPLHLLKLPEIVALAEGTPPETTNDEKESEGEEF